MTRQELESAALSAYASGVTWDGFWRSHWQDVVQVAMGDRLPLMRVLCAIVTEGDVCGLTELPDGYARPLDFELDAAPPHPLGLGSPEMGLSLIHI